MPNMPRTKKIIAPVIEPAEPEPEILQEPADVGMETQRPEDTFTFKRSHFYAVVTVLAFAVGVLLGYVVWGYDPSGGRANTSGQVAGALATESPSFKRYDVPSKGFYAI